VIFALGLKFIHVTETLDELDLVPSPYMKLVLALYDIICGFHNSIPEFKT